MRTSIFSRSWFGLATGVLLSVWAVPALADDCAEDSDCPKGFTCEVSETTACADLPACPEGENCEMTPPACTTEEYRSCQSIDCSADSDCAEGMACETVQHETCSYPTDPAPDPGMEPAPDGDPAEPLPADAAPPEGSCEVEERNYCVPRYMLTCETASDCGAGFTCETERCSCSSSGSSGSGSDSGAGGGSAGMPAPDGDGSDADSADDAERPAAPPPDSEGGDTPADGEDDGVDDESCVCESGPGYCQLVVTGCDASSDCEVGMTCEDNPQGVCTGGGDGVEECTADPEKICMPPYVDLIQSGAVDDAVEEGGLGAPGSSGGGEEDPTSDPNEPPRGSEVPGEEEGDDADADGSSDDASSSGGGCSVAAAGSPAGSWAGLGLLLGAAMLGRRRRS